MKKKYFAPTTDITQCEAIQVLAGTTTMNTEGGDPITQGEGGADPGDFANRSLWDDEEEE